MLVFLRVAPIREHGDEITGANVMFHDVSSQIVLINKIKDLERSASIDFLTQIPNRRLFERSLISKFEELQRDGRIFGIIFIDIDNFKKVNDTFGHDVGDLVLKMVAKKLQDTLRPYDTLGRWSGEEFVALVSGVDKMQLYAVASRLRSMVERASLFNAESVIKVTISVGATLAVREDTIQSLMKRADNLMYASKKSGKNKVTIEIKNN